VIADVIVWASSLNTSTAASQWCSQVCRAYKSISQCTGQFCSVARVG